MTQGTQEKLAGIREFIELSADHFINPLAITPSKLDYMEQLSRKMPTLLTELQEELKIKAINEELSNTDWSTTFGGGNSNCPLLQAIERNIIYPQSIVGDSEISYEKRTPYMEGWNDATMQITRNYDKIISELKPKEIDVGKVCIAYNTVLLNQPEDCRNQVLAMKAAIAEIERQKSL